MKFHLYFLFFATICLSAFSAPAEFVGSDSSDPDERAIAEVSFTIESDALPEKQEGTLYFVPLKLATERERKMIRAFSQGATIERMNSFRSWSWSIALWPYSDRMDVVLTTDKDVKNSLTIRRAANFTIERFADVSIEKAGIRLTLVWKKRPNQALQRNAYDPPFSVFLVSPVRRG